MKTDEMNAESAARLIDAASCITILRQARTTARGYAYRLAVIVRRSGDDELGEIARALGVAGNIAPISTRGAPFFQLCWYGQAAVAVLEISKPWLRERATEADLAVKFWRDGGFEKFIRGPVPEAVWDTRDAMYSEMRQLKGDLAGRERVVSAHRDLAEI